MLNHASLDALWKQIRNSVFPSAPFIGDSIHPFLQNPNSSTPSIILSRTSWCTRGSLTIPPPPTWDLWASNWGLTRVTNVDSAFIILTTAGITKRIEMNDRSKVTKSTSFGNPDRYLKFVRSMTQTRSSRRIFSATCP